MTRHSAVTPTNLPEEATPMSPTSTSAVPLPETLTRKLAAADERIAFLLRACTSAENAERAATKKMLELATELAGERIAHQDTRRALDRARAELGILRAVGRCGNTLPDAITGGPDPVCALPAGHDGWHRSDTGSEWMTRPGFWRRLFAR